MRKECPHCRETQEAEPRSGGQARLPSPNRLAQNEREEIPLPDEPRLYHRVIVYEWVVPRRLAAAPENQKDCTAD